MTAATHDDLLPRAPGGLAPGAVMSLLVHGGLIAALTVAVDWRMKAPEAVSAELWAAVPQIAAPKAEAPVAPPPAPTPAPPPPAPPPVAKEAPPPAPDIAIERAAEKRKKELQAKKDEDARSKAAAEAERAERVRRNAAQAKAEDARLAQVREEQMKRMLGSLPGTGNSTGTAAKDAGPSKAYVDRLSAMLRNSVTFPDNGGPNPTVEVRVRATATGTIISHTIVKKSGNDEFDDAVQRGLDRLGTLPRDSNGVVLQDFILVHRLRDQ